MNKLILSVLMLSVSFGLSARGGGRHGGGGGHGGGFDRGGGEFRDEGFRGDHYDRGFDRGYREGYYNNAVDIDVDLAPGYYDETVPYDQYNDPYLYPPYNQ